LVAFGARENRELEEHKPMKMNEALIEQLLRSTRFRV
jgi:hypothetical protein